MQDIHKLVRQCRDGNLDAFSSLFRHYQNRVYDLACAILRDDLTAEDVVQDTFLSVFQKIDDFKGESAFETWLTAIAVNQCRKRMRKRKLQRLLSIETLSPRRLFRLSGNDDNVADIVHNRQQRHTLWEMVDQFQERILIHASTNALSEMIALLFDNGANSNFQESIGSSALHHAARNGLTGAIPMLVENGALVDLQNNVGNTALHQAAKWDQVEAVIALVENGASLDLMNKKGQTALEVAIDEEVIEVLGDARPVE